MLGGHRAGDLGEHVPVAPEVALLDTRFMARECLEHLVVAKVDVMGCQ